MNTNFIINDKSLEYSLNVLKKIKENKDLIVHSMNDRIDFGDFPFYKGVGLCTNARLTDVRYSVQVSDSCAKHYLTKYASLAQEYHGIHGNPDIMDILFAKFCDNNNMKCCFIWPCGPTIHESYNYSIDHPRWLLLDFLIKEFTNIIENGCISDEN